MFSQIEKHYIFIIIINNNTTKDLQLSSIMKQDKKNKINR